MTEQPHAEAGAAQAEAQTEEERIMMRLEVHLASPSHGMVFREGPRLRREPGHVPRVARLLALAHHFQALLAVARPRPQTLQFFLRLGMAFLDLRRDIHLLVQDAQLVAGESASTELGAVLDQALHERVAVEEELGTARRALEEIDAGLHALDERRATAEAAVQDARDMLENVKFSVQELRLRRETLLEQFAATRLDLAEVTVALDAEANVVAWEQRLAETSEKIERLGQVNLAAIDEFREQSERKEYLDRQFADLTDALSTLEDAIRRIDRETRSRFQDTFDRINATSYKRNGTRQIV